MIRWVLGFLLLFGLVVLVTNLSHGATLTNEEAALKLYPSVGKFQLGRSEICTISKIGPREFLTAAHCVGSVGTKIRAQFNEEEGKGYTWVDFRSVQLGMLEKPTDKNHWEDWAILSAKRDTPGIPVIELDCVYTPTLGEPVAYMGFPYTKNTRDLARLFGVGYVSGVFFDTERDLGGHFTFDAPLAGGSSGSALISLYTGKIIGIVTRVEIGDRDIIGGIAESVKSIDVCEDAGELGFEAGEGKPSPF